MNSKLFRCFLLSFFVFSINCQFYDSEEPFDPFYSIDSATFDNFDRYGRTSSSFIEADEYKIGINLSSQNEYASRFGINPKQQNKIIDLNLNTLFNIKKLCTKRRKHQSFFLVENGKNAGILYQTIDDFLKISDGAFYSLDSGRLIFTNQDKIGVHSNKIIEKNDSIAVSIFVKLLFDDNLELSDTLKVTLISRL